jgi:hypothetical protein
MPPGPFVPKRPPPKWATFCVSSRLRECVPCVPVFLEETAGVGLQELCSDPTLNLRKALSGQKDLFPSWLLRWPSPKILLFRWPPRSLRPPHPQMLTMMAMEKKSAQRL